MILESSGQITIPAASRAKFNLREGDNVEVVEIDGALVIVQTDDTSGRGCRLTYRTGGTIGRKEVEEMSTEEIRGLLGGN
ncbi:AbrB/MazE/SpoVT family DNA-binding domain-containing protein [Nocardia grenadensis]|uniref:AbrB/MazE/SpoVT family DNA-binding domain-containing protein n=1 Tax=Nocardia grenadensis TaxID=931537 RepID=UPI003D71F1A2